MNMRYSDFQFLMRARRLTIPVWRRYFSLKSKPKLDDNDKFFVRQVRKSLKMSEFEVTVAHKPTAVNLTTIVKHENSKTRIPRKELMLKVLSKVKEKRKTLRAVKPTQKNFDGANYSIIGGVFDKGQQINEIAKRTTINDPYANKKPRHANKNYIGIEIEFNETPGVNQDKIAKALKDAGLARYINVTTDGSCGWEVRVLLPEENYEEPLINIMKVIKDLGHTADARCGTHVHFDMRNRDVKMVYENLFKTQKFLRKFVTRNRKNNRFCMMNKAETFDKQMSLGDRYYSLNVQSFSRHKTLEVRMHQGTLDANELLPWIKLLLKVVNYKTVVPKQVNTLRQARNQFDIEEKLAKNLEERIISVFRPRLALGARNV